MGCLKQTEDSFSWLPTVWWHIALCQTPNFWDLLIFVLTTTTTTTRLIILPLAHACRVKIKLVYMCMWSQKPLEAVSEIVKFQNFPVKGCPQSSLVGHTTACNNFPSLRKKSCSETLQEFLCQTSSLGLKLISSRQNAVHSLSICYYRWCHPFCWHGDQCPTSLGGHHRPAGGYEVDCSPLYEWTSCSSGYPGPTTKTLIH